MSVPFECINEDTEYKCIHTANHEGKYENVLECSTILDEQESYSYKNEIYNVQEYSTQINEMMRV